MRPDAGNVVAIRHADVMSGLDVLRIAVSAVLLVVIGVQLTRLRGADTRRGQRVSATIYASVLVTLAAYCGAAAVEQDGIWRAVMLLATAMCVIGAINTVRRRGEFHQRGG